MKKIKSKKIKILNIITYVLLTVLVAELIYFGIKYYNSRKNSTYYTIVNDVVLVDDGYVAVGLSDFKNSKFNKTKNNNKAAIWEYSKNYKVTSERAINIGFNGYFNSIIKTDDGYVAVGAIEMTETQHDENITEGLIVKYDKDFNILWRKNVQVLDDTEFVKVKLDKDGNLIIVGQSIYAKNIIGNQTTGGALLFKYDQEGKQLFKINYGGPQSGMFNDVYIENDGYVVVGSTYTNTGIIQKYNFKGQEVWHNYYGPTDKNGLTNIYKIDNEYLVTGTLLPSKTDSSNYDAVIVKFNLKGTKTDEIKYRDDDLNAFKSLLIDNENIIAVGVTGKNKDDSVITDAIYVKYDKSFEILEEKKLTGEKSESYNRIYKFNNNYLVMGFTNSKIKEYRTNGFDYYPIFVEY